MNTNITYTQTYMHMNTITYNVFPKYVIQLIVNKIKYYIIIEYYAYTIPIYTIFRFYFLYRFYYYFSMYPKY